MTGESGKELQTAWGIIVRWWWLFILGAAGAAAAAYFASTSTPPTYQARVKVMVERSGIPGDLSSRDLQDSAILALNYVEMIKTRPVLREIDQRLPVRYGPGTLGGKITTRLLRNIITISARDRDPVLAERIATVAAETFIQTLQDRQLSQLRQFQDALAQNGIDPDPRLIATRAALMSSLSIIEPATVPSSPVNVHAERNAAVAGAIGLILVGLGALLIHNLDDRIRSFDELGTITGMALLGSVPRCRNRNGRGFITIANDDQGSLFGDSYQFIRTNLEFEALGGSRISTLLVTSAGPNEGKTTTAVNLAISVAREGKSVIVVDSDFRRSALHRIFDLGDHKGLSQLILGSATLEEALAFTPSEGLRVMPSGSSPYDPIILLRSPNMKATVQELKKRADLVIFDSPPLLAVTDPMVLASLVDAAILVVDSRKSGRSTVKRAADTLKQAKLPHVGAVINKTSKEEYPKYGYFYTSDYSQNAVGQGRSSGFRDIVFYPAKLMTGLWTILFYPARLLTRLWANFRKV